MVKFWTRKEWKLKREEFLKDKKCSMCGTSDNLVIHHPQKKNKLSDEQYMSLIDVKVSCKKCHWAIHNGLDLCPECRIKYKKIKYEMCFGCQFPNAKKQEK